MFITSKESLYPFFPESLLKMDDKRGGGTEGDKTVLILMVT